MSRTDAPVAAGPGDAGGGFQIPSLDGIRAASFMVVFLSHAGLGGIVPGYFGLTLFFFLSGYLITTLMRIEFDRTGTVSLRQFYLRRVLRIFPPFYLVLVAAWLATAWGALPDGTLSAKAMLWQALHLTNYYIVEHGWWQGIAPGTWGYWSLAVEEHFYVVFPLLYLGLRRRFPSARGQALGLLALCALVFLWRCVLILAWDAPKDRTYVASDTRVDSILFGCLLAVWHNPVLDRHAFDTRRLARLWLPAGVALLVVSIVVREHAFDQTLRYTLQGIGLYPFFAAAILFHDRWPFRVFSFGPVRYVGLLSYSLYLLHTSVLYGVDHWLKAWPTAARGTFALALLIGLATLIYRWVELPCGRARKRLSKYLQAPVAAT